MAPSDDVLRSSDQKRLVQTDGKKRRKKAPVKKQEDKEKKEKKEPKERKPQLVSKAEQVNLKLSLDTNTSSKSFGALFSN